MTSLDDVPDDLLDELTAAGLDHDPGADDVGAHELRPDTRDSDLRGQVKDSVLTGHSAPDNCLVRDFAQHLAKTRAARSSLQHCDLVAPRRERAGDAPAEHPRRSGDEYLHHAPPGFTPASPSPGIRFTTSKHGVGPTGELGAVDLALMPDVDRHARCNKHSSDR